MIPEGVDRIVAELLAVKEAVQEQTRVLRQLLEKASRIVVTCDQCRGDGVVWMSSLYPHHFPTEYDYKALCPQCKGTKQVVV